MKEGTSSVQPKPTKKQSGHRPSSGGPGVKLSSNWLTLQKELGTSRSDGPHGPVKQKSAQRSRARKSTPKGPPAENPSPIASEAVPAVSNSVIANMLKSLNGGRLNTNAYAAGPSNSSLELATKSSDVKHLRKMILGKLRYTEAEESIGTYVAIDCEMVQVGDAREFSLARISIVNFFGHVVLDTFVKQTRQVTEYLTAISGIRPSDLKGPNAKSFDEVQQVVRELFKGRIVIGHSIQHDLDVLKLAHPSTHIRDTQLMTGKHPKLKTLVKQKLGIDIQVGEHNSVTDARAAMALFRLHKAETEQTKLKEAEEWGGVGSEKSEVLELPPNQSAASHEGGTGKPSRVPDNTEVEALVGPQSSQSGGRQLSKSALRALKKERIKAAGEVRDEKLSRSLQIKVKNKPDGLATRKTTKPSLNKKERTNRPRESSGEEEERPARRTSEKWWTTL
ncbi:3'-5' exonuclease [Tulasnella sp. UAMH 9824]|nr:3'-5' exonuclease [Tulasnella sp. UAMH 9824]